METTAPIFDGSLSESLQKLTDWKHKRYGLSSPKPFSQKISRAWQFFSKNRIQFFILMIVYFIGVIIGDALTLIIQNYINPTVPKTSKFIIIQLTSSWFSRFWRSILTTAIIYAIISAVKRRDHELFIKDLFEMKRIMSLKLFFAMIIFDIILSSPFFVAQALFKVDFGWMLVYAIFGLICNILFGMTQILIIEYPSISLPSCIIWSVASSLSSNTFSSIITLNLFTLILTPLIITEPFLLVLQIITFFEIFGYSSPAEVQYTTQIS